MEELSTRSKRTILLENVTHLNLQNHNPTSQLHQEISFLIYVKNLRTKLKAVFQQDSVIDKHLQEWGRAGGSNTTVLGWFFCYVFLILSQQNRINALIHDTFIFSFNMSYWFQYGQQPWTENPSPIKTDCKPLVPPTPFRQLSIQNKINLGLFSSSSCFAKIITMQLLQLPSFNKYILLLHCATAQPHPWLSSQKSWQLWAARLRTLN